MNLNISHQSLLSKVDTIQRLQIKITDYRQGLPLSHRLSKGCQQMQQFSSDDFYFDDVSMLAMFKSGHIIKIK